MNSIRDERIKEFKKKDKIYGEFVSKVDSEFKYLSSKYDNSTLIIMIFFEVVLYYNYKAIGVLQTKCDIEKRLKLTRNNENIHVASALLSSVYKVRNDMAHSNLATSKDVKNLLEIISSIDSLDQMKAIVDLLIPGDHPDCLANIYYLVERDSENPEYVKLKDSILKELCELRQDNKHKTIGEVRQKYAKSYEQDVVCYAILDVLKSFHIVR